jgi:hypothetical protein
MTTMLLAGLRRSDHTALNLPVMLEGGWARWFGMERVNEQRSMSTQGA